MIVWTTGVLCRAIHQPPVLGELTAGIIFGPPLLGIIVPNEMLDMLAELGAFFLMFYAGLETNPIDLKRQRLASTFVGVFGFFIPFAATFWACSFFDLSINEALFISMGLSITAIAVNARVLHDMDLTHKRVTPVIIGASIIDDVMSLAFFTAIVEMTTEADGLNLLLILSLMLKVITFFIVTIAVGVWIYPYIGKYFSAREAKGFTFALIMAFLFGFFAELAGLHIIIGAYLAGLFVREGVVDKDLMTKISDRFVSITYGFIGPIFFVSLAFHVTFEIFQTHLWLTVTLLIVAVLGKFFGSGAGAMLGKMQREEAVVVGCAMNGRGAVELVIASIGLQLGIISDNVFSILVLVAFVTTLLPPLSLGYYLKRVEEALP
ncbi:MAG: cation:proton antiporter [Desulfuromonadales bacterium]